MKYIALDFDGTILNNAWYQSKNFNFNQKLIKKIQKIDLPLIIISNQKGLMLGYHTEFDFICKINKIFDIFHNQFDLLLYGFYFCPNEGETAIFIDSTKAISKLIYGENNSYYFRKPAIGMGLDCEKRFQNKPLIYIGDQESDKLFAQSLDWPYSDILDFLEDAIII